MACGMACNKCGKMHYFYADAAFCCDPQLRPQQGKAMASEPSQTQIGGDHYKKLAIQPMEYSMANKLDPMQHTAIKYITRFRDKDGVKDLRKAIHTIEMLIEWEEKANG